jgi:hypothetical protein
MKRAKSNIVNSVEEKYRILFYEIIDNLVIHLSGHFSSTEKNGIVRNLTQTSLRLPFLNSLYENWSKFMMVYLIVHC